MIRLKRKDKGAILLTTLLVMSLMSALAVAMMDDIRIAILRSGNTQAHAQADWYVKAAEQFAESYVEKNFLSLSATDRNALLQVPVNSSLPIEGGVMTLTIMDGTQCLPLGALVNRPNADNSDQIVNQEGGRTSTDSSRSGYDKIFERLLISTGLSNLDASALTAAVIDWQDEDQQTSPGGAEDYIYLGLKPPYRVANTNFRSVYELRAVRGMTEETLQLIEPFICTGDKNRTGEININTLAPYQLPLLSAFIGENEESLAAQLIQSRPSAGYVDLQADLLLAGVDATKVPFEKFLLEPTYLWIEVDVEFGQASRSVLLEFLIDTDGLTRTYRHYGTEGRRPNPIKDVKEDEKSL